MKEYSKVMYGKKYTIKYDTWFELFVEDEWLSSWRDLDNIRCDLFELLLNLLYEVSLGHVVTKLEIIECYYKTELFIACFKQELES